MIDSNLDDLLDEFADATGAERPTGAAAGFLKLSAMAQNALDEFFGDGA